MSTTEYQPEVTVIEWEDFQMFFRKSHRQGEHVALCGQTGSGKTTLGIELCKIIGSRTNKQGRPASVVILATKPRDDTLTKLGWPEVKRWPPDYGKERCIVWPRSRKWTASGAAKRHKDIFEPLLDQIYNEGGQTVFIDEASYFERPLPKGLGMGGTMEQIWTGARSNKLTLVAGTQRPRHVSRSMWSEPSWVFIFPPDDIEDAKRVADLSGKRRDVLAIIPNLGPFEFLCIQRQRARFKKLYVSRVEITEQTKQTDSQGGSEREAENLSRR